MFGPSGTGRKYSLNFSVQALNLFNDINYGGPSGTLGSPHFNRSTTLAGGIFSTGSAARRVFAQVIFSFYTAEGNYEGRGVCLGLFVAPRCTGLFSPLHERAV